MLAIRGVFDGERFEALPEEPLPNVDGQVPVAIVFLPDDGGTAPSREQQAEAARRMRAARDVMAPLGMSVKELVEAGRER